MVAFDHCRVPLRQFGFVNRHDQVSRLHQLALEVDPLRPKNLGPRDHRWARVLYFLVCLEQIPRSLLQFGRYVRKAHRISLLRQWRDLWHCMWKHNQFARHYYWRKLFLEPQREAWLNRFEHREINTLLDYFNQQLPFQRVAHKVQFNEHCLAHGLPTPPILMAWKAGGERSREIPHDPASDVFIKPAADFGSVGALLIPYSPCSQRYQLGGRMLYWQDLLVEIGETHAQKCEYILQRRIRNGPASSAFGQDDVCNLRIVTGRLPNGTPELIASVMRVPSSYTTAGHDRNVIFSSVNVKNGRMGKGLFRNITLPQFTHHPDTGHKIEGRPVPRWEEMVALVTRAHETFPWMPFIGWDVVDSDEGLVLLEGNAYWGADSAQLPGAPGLGETRFCEIYLAWYERFKAGQIPATGGRSHPQAAWVAETNGVGSAV